ncbi:glycosyltransferase [Streptomyces sp. NPDC004111]|uniref:glycosyltransferase n=1 Tax=Streptomyces sp. NPDC004111 TaxID=3364690 RepID=UPI0036D18AF1
MALQIALTAEPIPSHVSALDYVIRPALEQGHRVSLHGPLMFRRAALRRGVEFHRAGTSWTCDPVVQRTASALWAESGNASFNRYVFGDLLPGRAGQKAAHLLANWTRRRPDLVVAECSDLGAHLAARVLGLPLVAADNGLGPVLLHLWDTDVAPALLPLYKQYEQDGLPVLPPLITPAPVPWFYGSTAHPLRAVRRTVAEHRAPAVPSPEDRSPSARPLVYVSLGTLTTAMPGLRGTVKALYGDILAALQDFDCETVVSAGALAERVRRSHPDARVVEHVGQPALLRRAGLFVTHGGRASLLDAVQGATPVLALGILADQPDNADAFARLGLGRALDVRASRPEIADAVRAVLDAPRPREAMTAARHELARLPAVDLVELWSSARSRTP